MNTRQPYCEKMKRISGLDLARALALFGMIMVNFKTVMGADFGTEWMLQFVGLLEGRAAATFVVLAGIGIALSTASARLHNDVVKLQQKRISLLKRALLLIVVGLAYTPLWPADILHFYGFYMVVALFLLTVSNRTLWTVMALLIVGFVLMLFGLDYDRGWDWKNLEYTDLWTLEGMVRHIFFNGFHPVFPWAAFLIFGLWLGRLDLGDSGVQKRLSIMAAAVLIIVEGVSFLIIQDTLATGSAEDVMIAKELFGTSPIPPVPQYLLSAASASVLVILLSIRIGQRFSETVFVRSLTQAGQMTLTWYVGHVVLGMGILEMMGLLYHQSIDLALSSALLFCLFTIVMSRVWLKKRDKGPLEWMFRKIAG